MIHSYSKKAYPWDNACIESFHALLKDVYKRQDANASSIVREPTRPKIIKNASRKWESGNSPGVMPVESPTVAIAETLSNNASRNSIFSILAMIMLTERESERYNIKIHVAFRAVSYTHLADRRICTHRQRLQSCDRQNEPPFFSGTSRFGNSGKIKCS